MEHTQATHTVFNQTPPLMDYNLYDTDVALQEAVQREGAGASAADLRSIQAFGNSREVSCAIFSCFLESAPLLSRTSAALMCSTKAAQGPTMCW